MARISWRKSFFLAAAAHPSLRTRGGTRATHTGKGRNRLAQAFSGGRRGARGAGRGVLAQHPGRPQGHLAAELRVHAHARSCTGAIKCGASMCVSAAAELVRAKDRLCTTLYHSRHMQRARHDLTGVDGRHQGDGGNPQHGHRGRVCACCWLQQECLEGANASCKKSATYPPKFAR